MELSYLFLVVFILYWLFLMAKDNKSYYEVINNFFVKTNNKKTYEDYILWDKEKIINEIAKSYGWEKFAALLNPLIGNLILVFGFIITLGSTSIFKIVDASKISLDEIAEIFVYLIRLYILYVIVPIIILAIIPLFARNHTEKIKLLEAALKEKETGEKE